MTWWYESGFAASVIVLSVFLSFFLHLSPSSPYTSGRGKHQTHQQQKSHDEQKSHAFLPPVAQPSPRSSIIPTALLSLLQGKQKTPTHTTQKPKQAEPQKQNQQRKQQKPVSTSASVPKGVRAKRSAFAWPDTEHDDDDKERSNNAEDIPRNRPPSPVSLSSLFSETDEEGDETKQKQKKEGEEKKEKEAKEEKKKEGREKTEDKEEKKQTEKDSQSKEEAKQANEGPKATLLTTAASSATGDTQNKPQATDRLAIVLRAIVIVGNTMSS